MRVADSECVQKEWTIESVLGQEKYVMKQLRCTFEELHIEEPRIEEMVSAVSEACLNAIEHGNKLMKDLMVNVNLLIQEDRYMFRIMDQGKGTVIKHVNPIENVGRKLEWDNPRGWGLQLMSEYADYVAATCLDGKFCVELHFLRNRCS